MHRDIPLSVPEQLLASEFMQAADWISPRRIDLTLETFLGILHFDNSHIVCER